MAPKKRKSCDVESSDEDDAIVLEDEEDDTEHLNDDLIELSETEEVGDDDGDADNLELDFEEENEHVVDECRKPIVSGTERISKPKKIRVYPGSPLKSESDSDIF